MKKNTLIKIGVAVTTITAALYTFNKLVEKKATKKGILAKTETMFYDWKLGRIAYTVQGVGSPVLLVHDSIPCSSMHEWSKIKNTLAKEHTVFCIDLLGCGTSDRPKMTYASFVYVQLITDFIKNVIKEKTDVVTNGLSGAHAIMACKNGANIGKLVMFNPKDLAVLAQCPTPLTKLYKAVLQLPILGTFIYNLIHERISLEYMFTEEYLYDPDYLDDNMVDAYYEAAHLAKGDGKYLYASLKGNFMYLNVAPSLKTITQPIYIIEGDSQPHAAEALELYKSLNPRVSYEVLEQAKFLPHLECPNDIAQKLIDLL